MNETSTRDASKGTTKTGEDALDKAVEDSMDASDPPAITRPGNTHEPAESSGFDAEEEKRRKDR
ncbi:hypothetical protein [Sphingomonas sanxanigenens]|uniref:Uncharacterized protein n=1 Tax=Sphingomonas sanxanigenens DSM 19645 = NX02 TaxID=1123269 RepID=W0AEF1_9SPHN|nr:hypothetical protein [Sphingomonas sanxanigenens]AHE56284.1 hypothetical protein NX02_23340 [Sphingomonas sanxanigenens DSM 19645 = NX02]